LNFEKLTNLDLYSIKLNNKYRLEMEIEWENDDNTIGTFIITGISKHYE
jgi:proteic killer suppression protein